ncbi:hydrogenase iron-sulfur subunit [uncultured Methanobacterium sp.]|uniref:hydrogenase iron-sulfur subunit n=1 Tax=uncultured Methanobacterium sp. TaxID=176306 RepID=UPI002AA84FD3|nr:hydrogenase iron-sulfur subunit [uncultured Methanobacterium sp.]
MKDRCGIFICQCGGNISDEVDIQKLKTEISEDAVTVEENPYLCSTDGQEIIKEKIRTLNLDRVVIAACSPKFHENTFRRCAEDAGLNKYMVEVANIREQCAWVDKDPEPTSRAGDIIRSSTRAIKAANPRNKLKVPVSRSVLVVGGGISGITASLLLASQNFKVYLVEKAPTIGGNMVKIGKVFSSETLSEECAMCSLGPLMGEVAANNNIEILTQSQITGFSGTNGNFTVDVSIGPRFVDEDLCTSCGECSRVCNLTVPDEWNASLSTRTAAYKPFAQAIPSSYAIDAANCVKCGTCMDICPASAIDLDRMTDERQVNVGAVVIATGHEELDPAGKEEFGYSKYPEVITQMELARILAVNGPTSGKLELPSTGEKPQRIVMIQCVGSRDRKPGSYPHCSTICCTTAIKHSNYIINHFKNVQIFICYTDIRTPGTYENYYFETQKKGEKSLRFIRGKVAEIRREDGQLTARVEDTLGGGIMDIETDMVVLSCALKPSKDIQKIEETLGVSLTPELFVKEKHPKMEPTQTTVPGIYVSGTARGAMDITDSINMSRSAASNALELLNQGEIIIEPEYAVINTDQCDKCMECFENCLMGAITMEEGLLRVNPAACSGCGECLTRCQEGAITLLGSDDDELTARIDGHLEGDGEKILAFLDKKIAYVAADNIGANRQKYPSTIRIIPVPSILRLKSEHMIHALNNGARGVFLSDGNGNASGSMMKEKLNEKVGELKRGAQDAGIDPERITFYEAYLPHYKGLASRFTDFDIFLREKLKDEKIGEMPAKR